jgi:hypothetical protein
MNCTKMRMLSLCLAIAFIFTLSSGWALAEQNVTVEVKDGPEGAVRPDLDTAAVNLSFSGVQNGSAHIKLVSPEKNFFSPTDFPWVEGTELIDATVSITEGKASFQYMFPIRGEYPLTVEWSDENGNPLGSHQLVVSIQENAAEIQKAILFIAIVGAFGLLAGFALSKRRGSLHAA